MPDGSAFSSASYWEIRYLTGETSGLGSTGRLARFKADILNALVREHDIRTVLEFGCGDGEQLALAEYPLYLGLDVSPSAVEICRRKFAGDAAKRFSLLGEYSGERVDLVLSLDVIYHLVEDLVYDAHMAALFAAARRFVVIYSSDTDEQPRGCGAHCRLRQFSSWVAARRPDWRLLRRVANLYPFTPEDPLGSLSDFFVYAR